MSRAASSGTWTVPPSPGPRVVSLLANRRMDYLGAPLLLALAVIVIELQFPHAGHATHLLLLLIIGAGMAFRVGPGPAGIALLVGGGGSATASLGGLGTVDPVSNALAQLILYGIAAISLLAAVSASRRGRHNRIIAGAGMPAGTGPDLLTARELEILRLAALGHPVEEIADLLVLSPNTIKTHLAHAYQKLGARNRSDAIRAALHSGALTAADICPHHEHAMPEIPSESVS